jgi:Tat protein secretion system quality control protein TatD with DNase activity
VPDKSKTEIFVEHLYEKVAEFHGITVEELHFRTTKKGERLFQKYYESAYCDFYA